MIQYNTNQLNKLLSSVVALCSILSINLHPDVHDALSLHQNLVMFLSLLVAWVIPDVPKNISEQLKREKTLLVDVFLREEKEKFHLLQSLFSSKDQPSQGQPDTAHFRTLPLGLSQGLGQPSGGDGGESRARCRAASFSQFTRRMSASPSNDAGRQMSMSPSNDAARHTAV